MNCCCDGKTSVTTSITTLICHYNWTMNTMVPQSEGDRKRQKGNPITAYVSI